MLNLPSTVGVGHKSPPFPFDEGRIIESQALPPPVLVSLPTPVVTPPKIAESSVIRLSTETYEKAKKVAPGWDVYFLEQEWREWVADKEKPKEKKEASKEAER